MNVIDHAILIPASPAFIWQFLGDLSLNINWQEDCQSITFLTTQHEGKGARWRYSTPKGKEFVVEISAWYDTLGYEYIVVDGLAVGENKGRIRLQEIAEGTLVQWTFNYEVQGMLSGLRNSIGLKRGLQNTITDSLRNLYKYVQDQTGGISTHEAKALLREAPDVDARSTYQPRHPSAFREDAPEQDYDEVDFPSEKQPINYAIENERIPEPPVAEDDTKPNPVVQDSDGLEMPVDLNANYMPSLVEPPIAVDDTKPTSPIDEVVISEPGVTQEAEHIRHELPSLQTSETPAIPQKSGDIRDTASVSVFEVFGLQKPSETQEMRSISVEDEFIEDETSIDEHTPPAPAFETDEHQQTVVEINQPVDIQPVIEAEIRHIPADETLSSVPDDSPDPDLLHGLRQDLRRSSTAIRRRR